MFIIEDDNQNGYFIHDEDDSLPFDSAQAAFDWIQEHADIVNQVQQVQVNINPHNINFALNTKHDH